MALRVTESIDGKFRASVRVEFRFGVTHLGEALLYLADREVAAHDVAAQLALIEGGTRDQALAGLRRMFADYGVSAMEDSGHELPEEVEVAAYSRAAYLFPEFAEARS